MSIRTRVVLAAVALVAAVPAVARAAGTPLPDPNFATTITKSACTADPGNEQEAALQQQEGWNLKTGRYPGDCQRLHFVFGPILVKPGQNDVLVEPITIERPWQDGFITRFKPDLVREDGTVPPIEEIHLHHGTWLSLTGDYGSGPFFAAGEEKTIAPFPRGFGMPVKKTDQWALLYMIHSAVPTPDVVYITYDIDFVPQARAAHAGLKPVYPIWLDVRPSSYPVFNVQQSFGDAAHTCTWPKQQCAAFDPYGKVIPGQGAPANSPGTDWRFPSAGKSLGRISNFKGGTLVAIGGHLHPGGLTNDIDLVRNGVAKRIYTGEAKYWAHDATHTDTGGPATSWDFSMTVTGEPRWGVHVQPGDILRSNATYDTSTMSTYEDMGIAIAFIAPDLPNGTPTANGLDPFTAPSDDTPGCTSGGLAAATPTLCDKGVVTHGHLKETQNYGGTDALPFPTTKKFRDTSNVAIGGFLYVPGDLSMIAMTGIPTARQGAQVQFTNADLVADVYHTVTACAYPCMGTVGTAFPLANGQTKAGKLVQFDSGQLGFGIPQITGAKEAASWKLNLSGYQPGDVVTFFCRIHPFMRGAIEVTG